MAVPITHIEYLIKGTVPESDGTVRTVVNVFHFRRSVVGSTFNAANVLNYIDGVVQAYAAACLSVTYTALPSEVRSLDDHTSATIPRATANVNGAVTGDRLPLSAAVQMRLKTALRGKSFVGRKHFAPIAESDTTLDELTSLTDWHVLRTKLALAITDPDGNVWTPCVVSRVLSDLMAVPAIIVSNDVTSCLLTTTIGNMKRRKQRGRVG